MRNRRNPFYFKKFMKKVIKNNYMNEEIQAREKCGELPFGKENWEEKLITSFLKDIKEYSTYERGYDKCIDDYAKLIKANISCLIIEQAGESFKQAWQ